MSAKFIKENITAVRYLLKNLPSPEFVVLFYLSSEAWSWDYERKIRRNGKLSMPAITVANHCNLSRNGANKFLISLGERKLITDTGKYFNGKIYEVADLIHNQETEEFDWSQYTLASKPAKATRGVKTGRKQSETTYPNYGQVTDHLPKLCKTTLPNYGQVPAHSLGTIVDPIDLKDLNYPPARDLMPVTVEYLAPLRAKKAGEEKCLNELFKKGYSAEEIESAVKHCIEQTEKPIIKPGAYLLSGAIDDILVTIAKREKKREELVMVCNRGCNNGHSIHEMCPPIKLKQSSHLPVDLIGY